MLAYSAVFGAAVTLVRVAPERWPAVLGGVTLAAVVVCGYALLTKVFPDSLAASSTFARLESPFGYWNATGLMAAMGAIGCLWLGSRRSGHALLSALAYPAMGIVLVTLALAYSRGALAALALGAVLWFCIVPLRLRGAAVLLTGGIAAGCVAAYDFSTHALSSDNIALAERTSAGHRLGALLLAMVLALSLAGIAIGFYSGRRAPTLLARRRVGGLLLALIAVALVAFAGALAHSHRGFTGSISHDVNSLTNPNAKTPPNTPGRLTAVASVRARYWKEALEVFSAHPALGAGAMGYQTARLRWATRRRACATARRPWSSRTRTASSCRRSPTSASSAWRWHSRCSRAGWPRREPRRTRSTAAGRRGAAGARCARTRAGPAAPAQRARARAQPPTPTPPVTRALPRAPRDRAGTGCRAPSRGTAPSESGC
jgi:hypothetical protein